MNICASMIVKNEQEMLERCLRSIRRWVDEIVVVDTGSTDNTVQILKRFGAKVYHHPWEQDFSKARNQAIDHLPKRCDWFLIIDADEEVVDGRRISYHMFRNLMLQIDPRVDACMFTVQDRRRDLSVMNVFPSMRLIRNHVGARWESAVHNRMRVKGWAAAMDMSINHYGYGLTAEKMQKKLARINSMLDTLAEKEPNSPLLFYYRANTAFSVEDDTAAIDHACTCLNEFAKLHGDKAKDNLSILGSLYHLLVSCYIRQTRFHEWDSQAWKESMARAYEWCQCGLGLYPEDLDLNFDMAFIGAMIGVEADLDKHGNLYMELVKKYRETPMSAGVRFMLTSDTRNEKAIADWLKNLAKRRSQVEIDWNGALPLQESA